MEYVLAYRMASPLSHLRTESTIHHAISLIHLLPTCKGIYITQTERLLLGLHNNTECNSIELCIKISVVLCMLRVGF